jgi:hypothetical protein
MNPEDGFFIQDICFYYSLNTKYHEEEKFEYAPA